MSSASSSDRFPIRSSHSTWIPVTRIKKRRDTLARHFQGAKKMLKRVVINYPDRVNNVIHSFFSNSAFSFSDIISNFTIVTKMHWRKLWKKTFCLVDTHGQQLTENINIQVSQNIFRFVLDACIKSCKDYLIFTEDLWKLCNNAATVVGLPLLLCPCSIFCPNFSEAQSIFVLIHTFFACLHLLLACPWYLQ